MSGTSNPAKVYHRNKQRSNLAGQTSSNTKISNGYHSIVSSEAISVTTKDHTTSGVVLERKVINVLPHENLHSEETVRNGNVDHFDPFCLNDSCSSSKSSLDLDTVRLKTDTDDLGECSSSGDLPTERLRDKISERSLSRDFVSAHGTDVIYDNCFRRSCKLYNHPENISLMVVCDDYKDTSNLPHFEEMPGIKLFCAPYVKTKESLREISPGRVDDVSPHLSLGNACKEPISEDESQENPRAELRSEDKFEGNVSGDSRSDDEFEGNVSRDSRSEGIASRQTTQEGEILGNFPTDSTSEDQLEEKSNTYTASEDEIAPITLMLKDRKPFTSRVRIGSQFQADVPEWSGPVINESYHTGEPLEISVVGNLHDTICKSPLVISSIGNWLQCREIVDRAQEGVEETICGKWRRAPLFEVQTDDFECFDCILWDPYHADCVVAQELDTDEVMNQLKYIEMLRPWLAAKRRKLDGCTKSGCCKKVISQKAGKGREEN